MQHQFVGICTRSAKRDQSCARAPAMDPGVGRFSKGGGRATLVVWRVLAVATPFFFFFYFQVLVVARNHQSNR